MRLFFFTGIFAFAMGLLETIVVIYLRQLYYPQGFTFPLVEFSPFLFKVEFLREAVTVVMLLMVGILAGKSRIRSFAFFLYSFAVWDISYYVGLKWLLNWPSSFFTWDILFLITVVWVGPVLAPVLCSIAMIILAAFIIKIDDQGVRPVLTKMEWFLQVLGSVLILIAFMWDYSRLLFQGNYLSHLSTLSTDKSFHDAISNYVPLWFNWPVFGIGIVSIICSLVKMGFRFKSTKKSPE